MLDIVAENNDFIILNKPAGIGFHNEQEEVGFFNQVKAKLNYDLYSVHRLDKVTSGLIVFAKTSEVASEFGKLFQEHKIQKYYFAIAKGKPNKKQGLIKGDIVKARRGAWKLTKSCEKPSLTQFFSYSLIPGYRIYVLKPLTGKTHQLRVVMKSLGVPILGDISYSAENSDRVYLHAYYLKFNFKGKDYAFDCKPNEGEWFNNEAFINHTSTGLKDPSVLKWPAV